MGSVRVPYIDPNVEHVGVSRLRALNAANLRDIKKTLVIQDNENPLAVLLKYEQFLIMQNQLQSLLDTLELVMNDEERTALLKGLDDLEAGRTRNISEIRESLKKRVGREAGNVL